MFLSKLSKILLTAIATSLFVGLAIGAGGAYKLSYRMKKGQRLKYKTNLSVQNSMEVQGSEITSGSEGASVLHLDIEEVGKDGRITYVYALDSLQLKIKTMQMDSTLKNPDGMIGKRTRQIMTAFGKKLKSVAIDSINLPGVMAQSGVSRQSAFRFIELADKAVKIGDSWTVSTADTSVQAGGKIIVNTNATYTVAGAVDTLGYKCLRLTYNGKIRLKGNGVNMGMDFSIEGEGPTSGTAYFAPKEGRLVAVVGNSDLETTVALTGQMTMTIPQSTASKLSVVLVK
jgi:hypothetical protein